VLFCFLRKQHTQDTAMVINAADVVAHAVLFCDMLRDEL
jgi:hypothetical protein